MYENVGKKIQIIAIIGGILGAITGVILFFVFFGDSFLIALLYLLGGGALFMGSWFVYGFGQVVDDISVLRDTAVYFYNKEKVPAAAPKESGSISASDSWKCSMCGKENKSWSTSCVLCGDIRPDRR